MAYPQILVAQHKRRSSYYIVNSPEDVLRAKVQMILGWKEAGMLEGYDMGYVSKDDREAGSLTDEQIAALPASLAERARRARMKVEAAEAQQKRHQRIMDLLDVVLSADTIDEAIAVRTPEGRSAVNLIVDYFGDGEYMEWSLENAESLTDW